MNAATIVPTPLLLAKEAAIPLDLIERLRRRQVVAFVGSGLSMPLGLPSWSRLISIICERVAATMYSPDPRNSQWLRHISDAQPEWAAEVIHGMGPDKYFAVLRDVFGAHPSTPFSFNHSLLALLPFQMFLTTNFDTLIEQYVSLFDWHKPVVLTHHEAWQASAWAEDGARRILKIHGSVDKDPHEIVLRASDYADLERDPRHYRLIASLFSRFGIITFGYSLRDRQFRTLVEERRLAQSDCPPMYCVLSDAETCPAEISIYASRYNVRVIPISDDGAFAELSSFLLSLYCLIHRVDSSAVATDITRIIATRGVAMRASGTPPSTLTAHEQKALSLLSVFREPVELTLFTTLCTDCSIDLTPAHYRSLGCDAGCGRIGATAATSVTVEDRKIVAQWLTRELDSMPLGGPPRYFSVYHKAFLDQHVRTLEFLLLSAEGWTTLIPNDANGRSRLARINEYFRQAGMWSEWLAIADVGQSLVSGDRELQLMLLRSKAWVYFWTRRYDDLEALIEAEPEIDNKEGESSYRERLRYMDREHLHEFVSSPAVRTERDHFSHSLLGRAYARVATTKTTEERKALLFKAREHVQTALEQAKVSKDLIEASVQSWYLACILSDLGDTAQAQIQLAEVRRLDESIMSRVPGLAWLKVAEYRFEANRRDGTAEIRAAKRAEAVEAMTKLGVQNVDEYVDRDYYF
ncbi:MAG: SIR2 family protein [Deltaproteobacteria bacterium]|nr:SIR2 family protein [Deltaproteobacteria bacterium]